MDQQIFKLSRSIIVWHQPYSKPNAINVIKNCPFRYRLLRHVWHMTSECSGDIYPTHHWISVRIKYHA